MQQYANVFPGKRGNKSRKAINRLREISQQNQYNKYNIIGLKILILDMVGLQIQPNGEIDRTASGNPSKRTKSSKRTKKSQSSIVNGKWSIVNKQ